MSATTKIRKPLTSAEVRAAMLRKLEGSALDAQDAAALKVKPYTAEECKRLGLPALKAGFVIPYFDINGELLAFYRYRYLEDTRSGFQVAAGKKPLRYAQPPKTDSGLYFPPIEVDWNQLANDAAVPLIITEGELKAACATKHGLPTIGLGGVWSFQSKKHSQALLPEFDAFEWSERKVYIVYDSDAATNPDVVGAEARLAQRLIERGAEVYIGRIPSLEKPGEEDRVPKCGLDDYIVAHGVEQFQANVLDTAIEYAASQVLHQLNNRVVYVRDPGLIWDHQSQMRIACSAFTQHAFSNLHYFEERVTKSGTSLVKVKAAQAWLEWEHRSEVAGITFAPNELPITEDGRLNSWTGWGVPEPEPGDVSEWHRLMDHLFDGDDVARHYFQQWCAYPLQNPGAKMHVAAAIWGPVHGSGKTLVGNTLMRIYGNKHSAELKDADLEDARFEWAEGKQFILADDITARGDRKFMRKLMTMITQHSMRMNPKYVPSYSIEDRINYYFTSNDPDALFMDDGDRRFFVHEVRAGKFDFHRYVPWMKSASGPAALWHYLLSYDMKGFDAYAPAPTTIGKESMIELGKSELGAWVRELKLNTDVILNKAKLKGDIFSTQQLHFLFDPNGEKKASVNALARELKRAGFVPPATGSKLRLPDGRMISAYAVRNMEKWREAAWRDACAHYNENNPDLSKPASKKF